MNKGEDEKTTLAGADREFATELDKIHTIFIADRDGEQTTLERADGYWIYNGTHKARASVVGPLLQAIEKVRIKYKPPQAAVENMVSVLATHGIKVELYDKQENKIKAYYVGGSTSDERGTFMIMEGAEQPYVVELPAWEGNLSVRFKRKGDEWRSKLLFEEEVENIQSVSVEYPKQRQKSFVLEHKSGDNYEVRPFYEVTPRINAPMKAGLAEAYLVNFKKLSAEAFRNNYSKKDSVLQLIPFSIITLTNKSGDSTKIALYPVIPKRMVGQDLKTGEYLANQADIRRYFVDLNGEDFLLAQNRVLQEILWAYPAFFEEQRLLN
jgi:hypothetical protein